MFLASVIWGISPPVIKLGLNEVSTFTFLFVRFLLTSLVLFPLFLVHIKKHPIKLKDIGEMGILGILVFTVALSFYFFGIDRTTSIDASLIGATNPIIITIAGIFFLKEVVTKQERLGSGLALFGTLIIILQPIAEACATAGEGFCLLGQSPIKTQIFGNILIIAYLAANSAYTILTRRCLKKRLRITPFSKLCVEFFVATITIFPFAAWEVSREVNIFIAKPALAKHSDLITLNVGSAVDVNFYEKERKSVSVVSYVVSQFSFSSVMALLYMSLLSGAVAYYFYIAGLSLIEASEASVFTYIHPVLTVPTAYLLLGEIPSPVFLLGAVVIAAGVYLAETRKKVIF